MKLWLAVLPSLVLLVSELLTVVDGRMLEFNVDPSKTHNSMPVVDLNEAETHTMFQHWMEQAVSAVMAAVANQKLPHVPRIHQKSHEQCARKARTAHAKCVVQLTEAPQRKWKTDGTKFISHSKQKMTKRVKRKYRVMGSGNPKRNTNNKNRDRVRAKRSPVQRRDNYSLHSQPLLDPVSLLARQLTDAVREAKHKKGTSKRWHEVIADVQEISKKKEVKERMKKKMQQLSRDFVPNQISRNFVPNQRRPLAMKEMDSMDEDSQSPFPKELLRAAQKIQNSNNPSRIPAKLIREGVKLAMMMTGGNMTGFDEKNIKLLSPHFMSLMQEKKDPNTLEFLSPDLLSLHKSNNELERATSLVDGFGMSKGRGMNEWLDLVMEASGVTDAVQQLANKTAAELDADEEEIRMKPYENFTRENITRQYGEAEAKKHDVFQKLHKSFTEDQLRDEADSGFFAMNEEQLRIVYGPGSPYNDTERLATLSKINSSSLPSHLDSSIRHLSHSSSFSVRQKDIILTPIVLVPAIFASAILSQPIILSPLLLSPVILSPAIFGPIILSPRLFVPVILSPRVLSPLILHPFGFSPLILSPLVLHPVILGPGIFNPIILSPLVLSPFILSPQVFTPVILSPLVMSPLILTPMYGSPLVLSPFVLNPLIYSPQTLFAVILSPHALSPLIESELTQAIVVLSPSWLS